MAQPPDLHVPDRPLWDCTTCGEPWPCAPAKVQLGDQYWPDLAGLRIYLGIQMWEALDDATQTTRGPWPGGMRDRFFGWTDGLVLHHEGQHPAHPAEAHPGAAARSALAQRYRAAEAPNQAVSVQAPSTRLDPLA